MGTEDITMVVAIIIEDGDDTGRTLTQANAPVL
jgi:hypothetical protein